MTRYRVTVYGYDCKGCKRARVRGALVRFAGKRAKTNARGQATLRARVSRAGTRKMRATLPGYRSDSERIRVRRR